MLHIDSRTVSHVESLNAKKPACAGFFLRYPDGHATPDVGLVVGANVVQLLMFVQLIAVKTNQRARSTTHFRARWLMMCCRHPHWRLEAPPYRPPTNENPGTWPGLSE